MQKTFGTYGHIQEIRVFKDKGYAFVRWVQSLTEIISTLKVGFLFELSGKAPAMSRTAQYKHH